MAYVDNRDRSPQVEYLPDLRIRVTREYDVLNSVGKTPLTAGTAMFLAWGTADVQWPQALLIKQDLEGQTEEAAQEKKPARLTRVYEQLNRTTETQVGDPEINIGQDGLYTIVLNYIQYSVAAGGGQTFQTVGANSISSPHAAVLKLEERTDDGTLQRIKRTYISAGVITTDIQTKDQGALILETITAVNVIPTNPGGYTLIDAKTENVGGLPVYTYTFAYGSGTIDTKIETKDNGALLIQTIRALGSAPSTPGGYTLFATDNEAEDGYGLYTYSYAKGTGQISTQTEYRLSPDQGTTGVTVTTIKYLSTPSISSNPITGPGGSELISIEMAEQDGYRLWTGIYASGQGTISTEIVYKFDGNLTETTITAINTAPTNAGTLIKADTRNGTRFEDGTIIYTYTWAQVTGGATGAQISVETEYLESVDTGTHGITKTTFKYIVAPGSSIQPTSCGSSILVKKEYSDAEGYGIWTTVWAIGTGQVLYEYTLDESGVLAIHHATSIDATPTTPSAVIGGTVTVFEERSKVDNGYTVYDWRYAETLSTGQSAITTRGEPDGAILVELITKTPSASTPTNPGSYSLLDLQQIQKNGYVENRATYKKAPVSQALNRTIKFPMPGQINILSGGGGNGLQYVPPIHMDILATETIDYGTSQITTTPFTVKAWATVTVAYVPTNQPTPKQTVGGTEAATGYLAGATGSSGATSWNGIPVDSWSYTISSSTPSAPPSGLTTIEVQNDIYMTDTSGTITYRRKVVTYTF
jgi:hypothetical protein